MKRTAIEIKTFAGLELDKQPLLATNKDDGRYTASTATNVTIDRLTHEVRKSKGSSAWISAALATGQIPLGMVPYVYPSGQVKYIVRVSSAFYLLNAALSSGTSISSTLTGLPGNVLAANEALQIPSSCQIGKHLVIVDGSGAYYWDGESTYLKTTRTMEPPKAWTTFGNRPLLALAASGTSLAANRVYTVWITFYSATAGHSPPLPCGSIRTDSSNRKIVVSTGYGSSSAAIGTGYDGEGYSSGLAAPPVGATHIYFWVQGHVATDKLFYQYATLAIDDGSTGAELTATLDTATTTTAMPNINGPPAGVTVVCSHIGRAWYTGSRAWPNRIWFSEEGQPFVFKPTSWIDVGPFDDPCVSLASFPYGSQLLAILKKRSVWSLAGWTEDDFLGGLQPVSDQCGCIAPHGVQRVESTIYFPSAGGFYAWPQGGAPMLISGSIQTPYLADVKGAA